MSKYTEGFYQSEETKALNLMNRLIKNYNRESEYVLVSRNRIFWVEGTDKHTIYIENGKFVIDGNEVYINSELWSKYVALRKLTGSMRVRAPKKIAFPDDWSDLSDEQVLENIQYLQKNYKKYAIAKPDDKSITIDNITISRDNEGNIGNGRTFYTINNKKYYRNEENAKELVELIHLCKMHLVPFKEKFNKWLKDNKYDINYWALGGTAVVALFVLTYFMAIYSNKSAQQSRQKLKQEIVNEVIDSLHKEQQKTINYNDSVKVR